MSSTSQSSLPGCPGDTFECAFCGIVPTGAPLRSANREGGSVLLRQGAPVDELWCVCSGRVKLSVIDADGAERAYGMRGAGSVLGLEALLGLPALFDAHVEVDAELRTVSPAQFEGWIATDPALTEHAMKHILAEVVQLGAERKLLDGTAESRLARFLLARDENRFLSAWAGARRHDVAGLLGMRPETLSRAIRGFERQGVVDHEMRVSDAAALRRLAREHNEPGVGSDEG